MEECLGLRDVFAGETGMLIHFEAPLVCQHELRLGQKRGSVAQTDEVVLGRTMFMLWGGVGVGGHTLVEIVLYSYYSRGVGASNTSGRMPRVPLVVTAHSY